MNDHSRFDELLNLYAVNALDNQDFREFEGHLTKCEKCQNEVSLIESALASPSFSLSDQKELVAKRLAEIDSNFNAKAFIKSKPSLVTQLV